MFETNSASMTRTVQRLERAGFVIRRDDASDGRATLVDTAPAGLALRPRFEELWAELEADTVGEITAAQRVQLLDRLTQIEANLAAATSDRRPPGA